MFSDRENKIIKIIGRRKVTFEDIAVTLFKDDEGPFDTNISVANGVRRIIKKCEYHCLNWTLVKIRENNKLFVKKEVRYE